MGSAIAEAIVRAGFDLTVYARTASKAEPVAALGARVAPSVADAVRDADVVLTSLRDDVSVTEVVRQKGGLLDSMRRGAVHVGATTISPALAAIPAFAPPASPRLRPSGRTRTPR